jgi:sialate O-acetylesterase
MILKELIRDCARIILMAAIICLCTMVTSIPAYSAVRLPGVLGSAMVLQRNRPIRIWGWADGCEKVSVIFNGMTMKTMASAEGRWSVTFPALKEGGPHIMVIKGENLITLDNILMGDVWVCSGQSNMEWSVRDSQNGEREIADAQHPQIRFLTVPKNLATVPVDDIQGTSWRICSPETAGQFSAVGYFFGREIHRRTQVPIGLINTSWGGTNIEAWTSADCLSKVHELEQCVKQAAALSPEELKARNKKALENLSARFGLTTSKPMKTDGWGSRDVDLTFWQNIEVPGAWEKKGLGDVDGIVWFRAEIIIPAELCAKPASLHLGKIDDSDMTYVNGRLIGETKGLYDKPREYLLPPGTLTPGSNTIAVRIEDTGGDGGFWGSPWDMKLMSGSTEIPLAGLWKCRPSPEKLSVGGSARNPNAIPACLYNGMIHPLSNLQVRGAIWYQGEANTAQAYQYRTLFPLMIRCWREKWRQPDMPFFFVQLANFMEADRTPSESEWAELREAQLKTLSLPGTGMAVTIDIGDASDIHPRNKQDAGIRLALNALRLVYGQDVVNCGPVYKSMRVDGENVIISFVESRRRLVVKDKYGYLKGFAIAGPDRRFRWAKARVEGDRVIVWSEGVKNPAAVRYAWGNNPDDANLFNEDRLPASPFRTDDWPGITSLVK